MLREYPEKGEKIREQKGARETEETKHKNGQCKEKCAKTKTKKI